MQGQEKEVEVIKLITKDSIDVSVGACDSRVVADICRKICWPSV
jgi:hypothetical protein